MGRDLINSLLHRKLKDGQKHNHLFEVVSCRSTNLGNGDTFFSVDQMADFVRTYSYQTSRLAKKWSKWSLDRKVRAIYQFLYDHIQYKIDEHTQQLRSPACSWHVRKKGIDCKSYSIFAGSILRELGIGFSIRQVRQPGQAQSQFTHVYIVVPKDQIRFDLTKGYLIIDATKHSNTEGPYLEAKDVFMLPHVGLNAPTAEHATIDFGPNRQVSTEAATGFDEFLGFLKSIGVSVFTIDAAREHFSQLLSEGIDPYFRIDNDSFILGRTRYPYQSYAGQRFNDPLAAVGLGSPGLANLDLSQIGGQIQTIASGLIGGDFLDRTIGAVLANGFDVSCWGASTNPKQAKAEAAQDAPFYIELSGLSTRVTEANLRKFVLYTTAYHAKRVDSQNNGRLARCTRKGHEAAALAMIGFRDQIISDVIRLIKNAGGDIRVNGTEYIEDYSVPTASGWFNGMVTDDGINPITINKYTIVQPSRPVSVPRTGTGARPSNNSSSTASRPVSTSSPRPSTSSRPVSNTPSSGGGFQRVSRPASNNAGRTANATAGINPVAGFGIAALAVWGISKMIN